MNGVLSLSDTAKYLLDQTSQVPAVQVIRRVREDAGIYAIATIDARFVPESFRERLVERKHLCVYVGKTSRGVPSLLRRLARYDLRGEGPSTFFCSLGVMLGYRPTAGSLAGKKDQNNFKFSRDDTQQIAAWVSERLTVAWLVVPPSRADELEQPLIRLIRPLLNLRHNPCKIRELEVLRREARGIARGQGNS